MLILTLYPKYFADSMKLMIEDNRDATFFISELIKKFSDEFDEYTLMDMKGGFYCMFSTLSTENQQALINKWSFNSNSMVPLCEKSFELLDFKGVQVPILGTSS
jgi:hypothetical protein